MQRAATSHNEPQPPKMSHNKSQPPTTSHELQKPPRKLFSMTLWTLCFIYDKMIIGYFYGLLFLIFNALLFSFVKFRLCTYHNSRLPSDLTKIKTSSAAFNFNPF